MNFDSPNSGVYLSSDPKLLDHEWIIRTILGEPWGSWRTHEVMVDAIRSSECFGLYEHVPQDPSGPTLRDKQIGFCRLVSDKATFTWLCDVVVDERYRAKGYGTFMINEVLMQANGAVYLSTRDKHAFYARCGFSRLGNSNVMRKLP